MGINTMNSEGNLLRANRKILDAFKTLPAVDRKKIYIVTVIQVILGFLDLLGVFAIGLVAVISVNGVKSLTPGSSVLKFTDFFGVSGLSFQNQVAIFGAIATIILIVRTFASMYFNRKILYYLSRVAALFSANLISKLLTQDLLTIQKKSIQETLYAVTNGVNSLFLNLIASVLSLITDCFLMIILFAGLFYLDVLMSLFTVIIFATVSLVLYRRVQKRISHLSESMVNLTIESNEKIIDAINSYRDLFVRNRRSFYINRLRELRIDQANYSAELAFIPSISKYLIEITLVLGSISICAIQFLLKDSTSAIATLSVFLAASTRIAPAILRIQSGLISIKSSFGSVDKTLQMIEDFKVTPELNQLCAPLNTDHYNFNANVSFKDISFTYPGSNKVSIDNANFEIIPGEIVSFVGPSGAGKTTIVDLLLGLLKPDSGEIKISGVSPLAAIDKWPGAMAYVPQDTNIINSSIKNNVSIGFPESEQINSLVFEAIRIAQLQEYMRENLLNLESVVGENGSKLSGGQRQRLGIARALYLKPKLIVLDEATSSLDSQTESDISDAIYELRGKVTVILIAHRLSTVRKSDKIVYMENGKILSIGNFEKVKSEIPNFHKQASLMGL
jgi:ABC-type multidrug transport system fused ATPase/permease subunit